MSSEIPSFKSCLGEMIQSFVCYKRALGCRFDVEEKTLRIFDRYLVEHQFLANQITPEIIDSFLASRHRPRPRSYNHLLCTVRRLFDWMVQQGYLERSPVQTRPKRSTTQRIPFLFDQESARCLLSVAGRLSDNPRAPLRGPTYRTIFALLYGLGLRVGEVARFAVQDLDWDRRLLIIRETKFYKTRLVPFGPRIAQLLDEYLKVRTERRGKISADAPLFSFTQGRPIHPGTISQTFRGLVPRLDLRIPSGVSPPCVHHLRHSFAVGTLSRWYRLGLDPSTRLIHLATFLGHVDITTTAVYLSMTDALLQEANRRFEAVAEGLLPED